MCKKCIILLLLVAVFFACEESVPIPVAFVPVGQLIVDGQSKKLSQIRFEGFIDTVHAMRPTYRIQLSEPSLSITERSLSGSGYVLELQIPLNKIAVSKEIGLEDKTYTVGDQLGSISSIQSHLTYYPNLKNEEKDTLIDVIESGSIVLKRTLKPSTYSFKFTTKKGKKIEGSFQGKAKHRLIIDGDSVGYSLMGDERKALQSGELTHWGDLFNTGLNYYEFQVYDTHMRRRDDGQLQNAYVFTFGIMSKSIDGVATGEYTLVKSALQEGLLFGHTINRAPWGTYWQQIESSSTKLRSNIWKGSLQVERTDDKYKLNFTGTDQLMKIVKVELEAPFSKEDYTQLTQKTK